MKRVGEERLLEPIRQPPFAIIHSLLDVFFHFVKVLLMGLPRLFREIGDVGLQGLPLLAGDQGLFEHFLRLSFFDELAGGGAGAL